MPYTTNVAGTTITAAWGNANVRDQVITPFASSSARTSAVTSAVEGMLSYRQDAKIFEGYDGSAWQTVAFAPGFLFARKTTDESLSSSTTLQNDDHLFVNVAANATYLVDAFLLYNSDSAVEMKFGWTAPAGATLIWNSGGISTTAPAGTPASIAWFAGSNLASVELIGGVGTGNDLVAQSRGILLTSGTSGTLQLQWAQGASSAIATTFKTNSHLMLRRVA